MNRLRMLCQTGYAANLKTHAAQYRSVKQLRPQKNRFIFLNGLLLIFLFAYAPVLAQHLDEVSFGDNTSEVKHGLTSFSLSKTEVYTGQSSLQARRFLPDTSNPYQGNYPGIYGGEVSFVLKVDGTRQNYITIKFSGDEVNTGRLLLNVEGKELGNRHSGNEELFMDSSEDGKPASPGAFFYRTAPIPRTLTDNKTTVTVRLRSTGRFFAYGTPGVYETYQRVLETATSGVYKAYMHTNPAFAIPTTDQQGHTPSYATAPANAVNDLAQVKANVITKAQNKITELLNGGDNLTTGNDTYYNNIEVLAVAYQMPYNTVAYHNPAVITKIRKAVDQLVINTNNGTQSPAGCWGGCFGRPAYAVSLVYNQLTGLDDVVDLGGASGLTRRQQWLTIFKASFNDGATNRKTITAQEMDNAIGVYGASLGLAKLDPAQYGNFPKVAIHHVLEACGIEEFTGPITNLSSTTPTLGTPATSSKGPGYFMMTLKGTSHEPGWVSIDCYGNLGPRLIEFWNMTKTDPNITAYGAGAGDQRILNQAVTHNRTQTGFTYPWTQAGKRCILAEGCTCWRNVYLPGKAHYGSPVVAGAAHDAVAFGYLKQMVNDGRFNYFESEDPKLTWFHFLPESIDQVAASSSTTPIPSTPGQPNYVLADEENGVITIKRDTETVFITLYNRAYSDNKSAKAHYITPNSERKIEFKPDKTEFYASGSSTTRTDNVTGDYSGNAPDKPVSGYSGQVEAYPSYNRSAAYNPDRALLDFYQVRYGKYLIAMNTTKDLTKTITVPADMVGKGGSDVATGTSTSMPTTLSLPPRTTKVYFVSDVAESPGLIPDTTATPGGVTKATLNTKITDIGGFAAQTATVSRVSTIASGGKYRYDLFDVLIRQLAVAKYTQQNTKATQAQVDKAATDLVDAYNALIDNMFPVLNPYQRVEAENFSSQNGVQAETTQDVDGNQNLSFVDAGDWTTYANYDFKSKGATKCYVRYALPSTATIIEIRLNDKNGPLVGTFNLQPTGGYQNWKTDSCIVSAGLQGQKTVTLVYSGGINVNWLRFDSTATVLNPYQRVEAESFSSQSGIETETTQDAGGGKNLSFVDAGDWTAYANANFGPAGAATFQVRYAGNTNTTVEVRLGSPTGTVVGVCSLSATGGNQNWQTATCPVSGATGFQNIYLVYRGGVNINWFQFSASATLNPYQRVEAESFSSQSGVETETTQDTGGGKNLSFVDAGDWTAYANADFGTAGAAAFQVRYAGNNTTTLEVHLGSPTGTLAGTCPLSATGGNQNWQTATCSISGATGLQTIYLVYRGGVNINWFQFSAVATVNPYQRVEAESYSTMTGAGTEPTSDTGGGSDIRVSGAGYWTAYTNTNFGGRGSTRFLIRYANADAATTVEVRLGSPIGTLAGTCTLAATSGSWKMDSIALKGLTGPQQIYLVYRGNVQVNWFQFREKPLNIDPYQRVEAEEFTSKSGVETEDSQDAGGGKNLSFVDAGDWTAYEKVDFGTAGATKFFVRHASPSTNTTVEVRLGSSVGTLVGTCSVPATGGNQVWQTDSCLISGATGIQSLYIVYQGGVNINWFQFSNKVSRQSQSIAFPAMSAQTTLNPDFNPGATATSGLVVSYVSSNTTVATVVSGLIRLVGSGTSVITASQAGNDAFSAATPSSQTLTVTAPVKVSYLNGDNNQVTNNMAKPYLTISNAGATTIPYSEMTIRYWFTAENYAGINTWIDYAQLGTDLVSLKYVALDQPRAGAYGYVEYSFKPAAGTLTAGGNSGPIQSRFANINWADLNEADDFSYRNAANYVLNDHITLYRNGKLIWGTEPVAVAPEVKLRVYSENRNGNTGSNTISTYLSLQNAGNVPVAYQDVVVRYWFTAEGTQPLNYWIDYAALGGSNVLGQFTRNVNRNKADTYFDLSLKPSVGLFYPASSTGTIQYRIAKTDWSNFNEANDYSYKPKAAADTNTHITVYHKGLLIYGTEPIVATGGRMAATDAESTFRVVVLENPIQGRDATIAVYGTNGQPLKLNLVDIQGRSLAEQVVDGGVDGTRYSLPIGPASGLYLLRVGLLGQTITIKLIKP